MPHISKPHSFNFTMIMLFACIMLFGLIMLASASQVIGMDNFHDPYYYLKHQFFLSAVPGSAILIIAAHIPYYHLKKIATAFLVFSIILLILVFIPGTGYGHGGANRWLSFRAISFQPSEIAKLGIVIFFAAWFAERKKIVRNFYYTFLPFLFYLGAFVLLIALQPDIGTISVLVISSLAIYWVAGLKYIHLFALLLIAILSFGILIYAAPYRLNRITTYFKPHEDKLGASYQINQSLIAIGSGGLIGLGFGKSKQKYQYLPEVVGDSIFSVIAEELGFILTSFFVFAYVYFILTGLRIAARARDDFGKYLATGIVVWFGYQTFVNMGAMVKLLPLTGLPLPFVSYGGSALMISMFAFGILLNISRYEKS